MARPRELPQRARIVIIGGGVGGTSIAYHLAGLGQRDAAAQLSDQAGGVKCRPAGQLVAVEQHDVALPQRGQVVGDRRTADTPADDHNPCPLRKLAGPRHWCLLGSVGKGGARHDTSQGAKWPGTCTF